MLDIGEGTTTTPGFFTMPFGRVKGRAEAALLEMSKTTPSFKPYSLRPALVDPKDHTEIHSFMPSRQSMRFKIGDSVAPAVRMCWPSGVSPTKDLGRVLMELAMSDGMPHTGEGVLGEGRTFSNVGFRRLAGL